MGTNPRPAASSSSCAARRCESASTSARRRWRSLSHLNETVEVFPMKLWRKKGHKEKFEKKLERMQSFMNLT